MEIIAVDYLDVETSTVKFLGKIDSGEAAADNHYGFLFIYGAG